MSEAELKEAARDVMNGVDVEDLPLDEIYRLMT
jgi:hypothetical protein